MDTNKRDSTEVFTAGSNGVVRRGAGDDITPVVRSCSDPAVDIKHMFLVSMPKDFYQLWEFCKEIKPQQPERNENTHIFYMHKRIFSKTSCA